MTPRDNNRVWATEKEAARLLGLSVATLRNWRSQEMRLGRKPRLNWRKFGGAVRYYLPDLMSRAVPDGQAVGT
jgi:hypothetical protein